LQPLCYPPPFNPSLLWQREHIERHLAVFPEGHFVATAEGRVVGSASNTIISEEAWRAHPPWKETVGGFMIETFDPKGTTLYGLDISVDPAFRGRGIARALYQARFDLVREKRLVRYGTTCRLPGFHTSGVGTPESYADEVVAGNRMDPTLTPLLKMNLTYLGVAMDHMDDPESGNSAAILEWRPE
jgi:GNAT superfamily N-acetyltransferase